jgi:hypothetical protein
MFWSTWSNSPAWEVDLLKLYNRLAFHQVSVEACQPEMLQHVLIHFEQFNSFEGGSSRVSQPSHLKILIPVGTAIIIVADVK